MVFQNLLRKGKNRVDDFSFEFNSPMTKEDWDKLENNEMEDTEIVTFKTPSGKQVPFQKVKYGKWIDEHEFNYTIGFYKRCSECGIHIQDIFFPDGYIMNFCPECGTDMRERREIND